MKELVVDNFAGGGGASTGIRNALGRDVDIAINHDASAIAMHRVNHPTARHYQEDVWQVDPVEACANRPVGLAWFSPDCKHFSKAKGGKPVDKKIRGLAWVSVRWAKKVRPRVIMLENVEEFQTWGPIVDGHPDPEKRGETFHQFVRVLESMGYRVEWKELRACDYGAPTIRKRFFLIARCDGQPIIWPEPTHGDPDSSEVKAGKRKPWVPVADVLDFSLPCPSIFATSEEIMDQYGIRAVRPLAEATMRRIAKGIQKFVIDNPKPYIVKVNSTDTIAPVEVRNNYGSSGNDVTEPLRTITTGGHHMLVAPNLIQYHSEQTEDVRGQEVNNPLLTVDASNRYGLVSTFISQFNNHTVGQEVTQPINTLTAQTNHFAEVRAFLVKYYGTGDNSASCNDPSPTITAKDRMGLVTVMGQDYQITDIGLRMLTPRELFSAQGFPENYVIDIDADGNAITRSAQVARCGNAVCPQMAEALVRANLPEMCNQSAA